MTTYCATCRRDDGTLHVHEGDTIHGALHVSYSADGTILSQSSEFTGVTRKEDAAPDHAAVIRVWLNPNDVGDDVRPALAALDAMEERERALVAERDEALEAFRAEQRMGVRLHQERRAAEAALAEARTELATFSQTSMSYEIARAEAAEAALVEARQERDRLKDNAEAAQERMRLELVRVDGLLRDSQAERDALAAALREYGDHQSWRCGHPDRYTQDPDCCCGLVQTWRDLGWSVEYDAEGRAALAAVSPQGNPE